MNLSEFCIKRPVFTTVLSLVFILVGIVSYHYLHTRFLPEIAIKRIFVITDFPGASAKLIETSVTTPIEQVINGITGIKMIRSKSSQGVSFIKVYLRANAHPYAITNKIRNKISSIRLQLPSQIKTPIIQAGNGSIELMDIAFSTTDHHLLALRDYLERYVISRIQQAPGVANVTINGASKYAMRIWLNPKKMAALGLSVNDVSNAIQLNNIELPAGEIKTGVINYPVTANTQLKTTKQFSNIVLRQIGQNVIRLKDIATVGLGSDNTNKTISRINGKLGVLLQVYNSDDANPLSTEAAVNKVLKHIRQQLPHNVNMAVTFNEASYMHESIKEVYLTIAIAILCVGIIIFLFLGRWRALTIPMITIPICLLSSFTVIYLCGFTINVITLLALVLAIGLVVDDAIVMMENIHRHIQSGMSPYNAAIKGSREITFAVIAMTLTLAAVYAPIGLIHNHVANVYQSFAFTLAGTVIISGFIALTLSPMMCARILPEQTKTKHGYAHFTEQKFQQLAQSYRHVLQWLLRHRLWIVIAALLIAVGGYFLLQTLPTNFMPREDLGFMVSIIKTPSGANLKLTEQKTRRIAAIIRQQKDVKTTVSSANQNPRLGFNSIFTTLIPYSQRKFSAQQLAHKINQKIKQIPGLDAYTFAPYFGGSAQHQLTFYIMGASNYRRLYTIANGLIHNLKGYPGLSRLSTNMQFNSQQYQIHIKRNVATELNVSVATIDKTLAALLGGADVSTFNMDGRNYAVYIQANPRYLTNLTDFQHFFVKSNHGALVPLNALVNVKPVVMQTTLPHYNGLRAAAIYAQIAPHYTLGQVVDYLQTNLPKLLPSTTKYAFVGIAKHLLENNHTLLFMFGLAVVFIYLVLAAQFESFIDPWVILLAVPLSIISALAVLKLTGGSRNVYTDIGLVTLIGLIAKHGILITQFANRLRQQGMSIQSAIIQAASIRLRPILMTTLAMIFGALPLLFTQGANSNSRLQIGLVIISGLLFGTFFSLVLVPILYSYAAQLKKPQQSN